MKKLVVNLLLCILFAAGAISAPANETVNVEDSGKESLVPLADPFILLDGNVYYAYGTHSDRGIEVYKSYNLKEWEYVGLALDKTGSYGDKWFWAPEVYKINGKYYMYYSADEHICVATSDHPDGPFRQQVMKPMLESEKAIDNSLFIDDDGTPYLFFVRFNDGNNIWVAELEKDLMTLKLNTLHPCIHVSQPWEKALGRVNEGPFVIKRNGVYYLTYSANDFRSPDYGIGCATTTNIMGTWTKYADNPVFQKPVGLVGVGHHALFTDKNGKLRVVFHAHHDSTQVHPRCMYIGSVSFKKESGADKLKIAPDYLTPVLIKHPVLTGKDTARFYKNPVVDRSLPDPSVIKGDDGYFYLFATEDIRNMPVFRSRNLVDWSFVRTAFTDATRPRFVDGGGLWAPDINKIGDKYVLYYAMSKWGGEWQCGIGRAVSDKVEGPYKDLGKLFISSGIGVQNSIDPCYVEDNGKKYLFWGSFHGIYAIRLSNDGLSVYDGARPQQVAGTAYEGVYIHKRKGYYYMFASTGSCCDGLKSTYETVVGRSKTLMGPYVDKNGRPMMKNHHVTLIHRNGAFVGTGHDSEIVTDRSGNDWLLYHAYRTADVDAGRVLMLDKINWKDGWPEVATDSPSLISKIPDL